MHALNILILHLQRFALVRAHSQENGLVTVFEERVDGYIAPESGVAFEFYILIQKRGYFFFDGLTRQSVRRNGTGQHTPARFSASNTVIRHPLSDR